MPSNSSGEILRTRSAGNPFKMEPHQKDQQTKYRERGSYVSEKRCHGTVARKGDRRDCCCFVVSVSGSEWVCRFDSNGPGPVSFPVVRRKDHECGREKGIPFPLPVHLSSTACLFVNRSGRMPLCSPGPGGRQRHGVPGNKAVRKKAPAREARSFPERGGRPGRLPAHLEPHHGRAGISPAGGHPSGGGVQRPHVLLLPFHRSPVYGLRGDHQSSPGVLPDAASSPGCHVFWALHQRRTSPSSLDDLNLFVDQRRQSGRHRVQRFHLRPQAPVGDPGSGQLAPLHFNVFSPTRRSNISGSPPSASAWEDRPPPWRPFCT